MKNIKLVSKLFFSTGMFLLIYSLLVSFFYSGNNLGRRWKTYDGDIFLSDIYMVIAIMWIIGLIYIIDDLFGKKVFNNKLQVIQYYLLVPYTIILVFFPLKELFITLKIDVTGSLLYWLFNVVFFCSILCFFAAILLTLIIFIRGLIILIKGII